MNNLFDNIKEHKSKAEKGADLMTWFQFGIFC